MQDVSQRDEPYNQGEGIKITAKTELLLGTAIALNCCKEQHQWM